MRKFLIFAGIVTAMILTGCRAEPEDLTLDDITVDIELASEQPAVGITDMLVTVATTDGEPVTDASVTAFGTMTHAGMVPYESLPVTENEAGVYTVPVEFSMGGDWIFEITVELANGESTVIEYVIDGVDGEMMDMDSDEMGDMDMDSDEMDMNGMDMSAISGAYVTITNNGDSEITLVAAGAEGVASIELHETIIDENDIASMVEQENGILVDSGETVFLEPGGLHMMLVGVMNNLVVDETLAITLEFDDGTMLTADFPVSMAEMNSNPVTVDAITITDYWVRPVTVDAVQQEIDMMETAEAGQ